jgi:hypothetical protein
MQQQYDPWSGSWADDLYNNTGIDARYGIPSYQLPSAFPLQGPTPDAPVPSPAPSPAPDAGAGGAPSGINIAPFNETFNAPQRQALPGAPQFNAPQFRQAPAFRAPSVDEALGDPGYKFRTGQGEDALQRWSAARGTLNDSGTAKALIDYGQNAASQEYQNVWNRDFNAYQSNYKTQYADPNDYNYRAASDAYAPQLEEWRTNAANTAHNNDADYEHAYTRFADDYARWRDQNFNIPFQIATA